MKKRDFKGLILPKINAPEAAISNSIPIYPVTTLNDVINLLNTNEPVTPLTIDIQSIFQKSNHYEMDFSDVKGQSHVKRGLEIAVAGGHNVLLIGPPGSEKSMLAKRMPIILPDMNLEEALEVTKIQSIMGSIRLQHGNLWRRIKSQTRRNDVKP